MAAESNSGEPLLRSRQSRQRDSTITFFPYTERWAEIVPRWAADDQVWELAQELLHKHNIRRPVAPPLVAGPAVALGWRISLAAWGFAAVVPWLVAPFCTCTQVGDSSSVIYPIWVWGVFGPYFVLLVYGEWHCFRYVSISQRQVAGPWTILGFEVPFFAWLCMQMLMSIVSHLDLATNGLFLATTLMWYRCQSANAVEDVWQRLIAQSVFLNVPGVANSTFVGVVLMLWPLSFIQPLYAWVSTMPLSSVYSRIQSTFLAGAYRAIAGLLGWPEAPSGMIDYSVQDVNAALTYYNENGSAHTAYATAMGQEDHGSAIFVLGEANRMAAVTCGRLSHEKQKCFYFLWDKKPLLAYFIVKRHLVGLSQLIIVKGIFENAFQLNIQILMLSITNLQSGHMTQQAQASIYFSIVMTVRNLQAVWKSEAWTRDKLQDGMGGLEEGFMSVLRRRQLRLRLAVIVYLLLLGYAVARLIAIYVCPGRILNLNGCVDIYS